MRRKSGYKPTVRIQLSEHIVHEFDSNDAFAAYVDILFYVARWKLDSVTDNEIIRRGNKKALDRLFEMGLLVRVGDRIEVRDTPADRPFRLFWLMPEKPKRPNDKKLDPRVRFEILRRDGFRCVYCGATPSDAELHVDHVQPRAAGGSNDEGNLVTACQDCNLGKGATLLKEPLQ